MKKTLESLEQKLSKALEEIHTIEALQDLKAEFTGKKSELTKMMQHMKDLPNDEKPIFGQTINEAKQRFSSLIENRRDFLNAKKLEIKLAKETIDVTLDGPDFGGGNTHLLNQIIDEIEDLFIGMGYLVKEGPEIESDELNFEKLNLPKDHPARDMQDSFYISEDTLLRTHTSPVQVRTMLEYGGQKPVKIICPGKVYRRDDDDATHSHQFMQIEGLVVDELTTMADLKGTLLAVAQAMFGKDRQIRLRPSYFPFTEPSVEVDVTCSKCNGAGCNMCKQTGYIEILGAGMVHNNVLEASGYDSKKYQGFAFGMGVERIAMLRYGIDDIRHFYQNDLRFNKQFK
ncbi:phenylalanine--tRNA ligase subunit alpha [Liberiplasma polymorphum]|uniref:phenylalanine--tRNA ligase subunit alpha n=1 Tax=Liberiplasma polymorphum TaxID=3374570 RepID=UPI0037710956